MNRDMVARELIRVANEIMADSREIKNLARDARKLVKTIRSDGIDRANKRDIDKLQKISDQIQQAVGELPQSMNTIFFTFASPPKSLNKYIDEPEDRGYRSNFIHILDEIDDVLDFLDRRVIRK